MGEVEIEKSVLRSVRLDSDVWDAVHALPMSLNQYLRKVLPAGGVFDSAPKPRRLSKKVQMAEARKAADPVAQNLGREDIDYMNPDELPSAGSVGVGLANLKVEARDSNGKMAMKTWRANRRPLMKPGERK